MEAKTTVYIVDDDPSILEALSQLVELIELKVQCYPSADEFLQAYQPTGPACLVLDVRMPGMGGLELQKELVRTGISLPIIIITGHGDIRMAVDAMKGGAVDFLEKPFRIQELCESIQRAIRAEREAWKRRHEQQRASRRMARLTPAERQVMDRVVAGKTNKVIAEELGLSLRAIEDRRSRLMNKLQAKSRAELLRLAGVVPPGESAPLANVATPPS